MIKKLFNKEKWCRLAFFNIAFFASVMWFWGLALATHKLESVYNTGTHFAHYFLYFTLIYFILVSIAYLIKVIINFSDVIEDFNHTVKSNFFPWVWKILLIFAIGFLSINMDISRCFWISWVIIQSIFTIIIFRRSLVSSNCLKYVSSSCLSGSRICRIVLVFLFSRFDYVGSYVYNYYE